MAVFGHSGSQAPQLMHSLVITVAIAGAIPWPPRPFKRVWSLGRADDRSYQMTKTLLVLIPLCLLAARAVRAEEHPDMQAAQQALETARQHLRPRVPSTPGTARRRSSG